MKIEFHPPLATSSITGKEIDPVPMRLWARDHWLTLAYIETRCVDHGGKPLIEHMRCDPDTHPHLAHRGSRRGHGTKLSDGSVVDGHDDWSCIEDFEAAGLVIVEVTDTCPRIRPTTAGDRVMEDLRRYMRNGGHASNYSADRAKAARASGDRYSIQEIAQWLRDVASSERSAGCPEGSSALNRAAEYISESGSLRPGGG